MDNTINSDLIRGHIDTIILKALYEGDRYGYDIIKDIEQKSGGQYQLKQPTLYSCLKRLETQGFISSYWGAKSNGGRRKYYALTDMGRELFIHNQTEWEYSRTGIDKLISDRQFNLSEVLVPVAAGQTEEEADTVSEEKSDAEETSVVSQTDEEEGIESLSEEETDDAAADTADGSAADSPSAVADGAAEDNYECTDTAEYFRRLFGEKLNDTSDESYSEKLHGETVEPSPKLKAEDFFKDFTDDYSEEDAEDVRQENSAEKTYSAPETPVGTDSAQSDGYGEDVRSDTPVTPYPGSDDASNGDDAKVFISRPEEKADESGFLSYDTPVNGDSEQELTVRREYKNILGELLTPPTQQSLTEKPEAIDDNAEVLSDDAGPSSREDRYRAGKFERLASEIKDLGDGIKIRTHNSAVAKTYVAENYYYSNKLMLHHYAILFGICLFEIIVMFLAMNIGFGVKQISGNVRVDLILYGIAVIGSLAFPVTAAVLNYIHPDKRKRCDFNFKSSMIFRCSLTLILLVLVYLINLCCGMKATSAEGYVPSLVIPMVMSFNFIFSTLIFNLLYQSKKFSVEE